MLLRETVQHCPTCDEVTPHSYRRYSIPKTVSLLLLGLAIWCMVEGGVQWIPAVFLLFAAAFVRLQDRDRFWNIACIRCRGYRLAELRKTQPKLGSTTIIDWM
jgi:hypothetical protein